MVVGYWSWISVPKRFARFGLRLHPDKTKLVDFRRPRGQKDSTGGAEREVKVFDFLGFTHYWAKWLKGRWVIKRKTFIPRSRMR